MLRVTAAAISPPEQKLQQIKTYFISKWPFLQFRFRFGPMADIAGIETIKATKVTIFFSVGRRRFIIDDFFWFVSD